MSDQERGSENNNRSRSRSRSPVRRRMSDDHGYERDNHLSRRSGNYNGRRKFADTYRGSRDRGEYRGGRERSDYRERERFNNRDNPRSRDRYDDRRRGRDVTGRYGNRRDDYPRSFRSRHNTRDDSRRGGFGSSGARGDYGPLLARELDSTYEEKVNRNYSNSIFVGNLTYDSTPEDLTEFFSQIGKVVRADIITSRGHHRGMGTVEFTNSDDVDRAIRQYDGAFFMDRKIFVRQDNPPPSNNIKERKALDRGELRHNRKTHEVIVKNLPASVNWQALKDIFKECGNVAHADVELDGDGVSTGSGTVSFYDIKDLHRAIEKYNGYSVEGNVLDVKSKESVHNHSDGDDVDIPMDDSPVNEEARKFTENVVGGGERNRLIYCSNLPFSTAKSDLYDLFETIGKVNNAELRYDSKGAPTGIAVVEYDNVDDADVCIERLNNYNYGGCDLDISYAKRL
ncbi:AGA_1a_G0048560.mRNA.1.CDS.1 [Saccharomyces cerevisiae]|nr:AGA_1a_G0048560.mRNA.1.CDS.1 [Saccharomyces cerevisiae]CAI6876920.1 AGA_1a_G0048560.mRNA.1.CDS.1 [Saccharomyces cerevisiae]